MPEIGRWLNRDPIGEEGGTNLYLFVNNFPTNLFDRHGYRPLAMGELRIKINRSIQSDYATLGSYVAYWKYNSMSYESFVIGNTLEPRRSIYNLNRGAGRKLYPIRAGSYEAEEATHNGRYAIRLNNVSNFQGILIHSGNYPWDTEGCILIGTSVSQTWSFVNSELRNPLSNRIWTTYTNAGMIRDRSGITPMRWSRSAAPNKRGVTAAVWGSNQKVRELQRIFNNMKDTYGDCAHITVEVHD